MTTLRTRIVTGLGLGLVLLNAALARAQASDTLASGESLLVDQTRVSTDGRVTLVYQGDGNVVLYGNGTALWATNTSGSTGSLAMQGDGNLVLYDGQGTPLWSTGTVGYAGAYLTVQSDGNLVLYDAQGVAQWATNTSIPPPPPVLTLNGHGPNDGPVHVQAGDALEVTVYDAGPDAWDVELYRYGACCSPRTEQPLEVKLVDPQVNPQTLPPFTAPSEQGDYELLLTATDVDQDGNPVPLASTALVTVDPPPPPPGPRVTVNGVDSSGQLDSVLPGTELTVVVENAPSNASTIELFRENECCWPANSLEHYLVDGVANPPPYTFTAPDVDGWYDVVLVSFDTDSEGNPIGLAAGPTVKVETPPPPNPVLTINGHENETVPELGLAEVVTVTVSNPSHRDNESVGFYDLYDPPEDPPVLPALRSELVPLNGNTAVSLSAPGVEGYYHVLLVYEDAQDGWQRVPNVNPPVVHVAPQEVGCGATCNDPRLTLDKTELHPGDTLTVTVANAPAESDRVQIWTSGTCCRGLPAMDAVGLGTPKDGDIPLTAPQKPADYYVVLLGTPQEPDGSPHIITQSVEFHVLPCLPGEQGCAPAGTDTRWFYDTDAIGSVRLITDDGGGTFARYDYAPFGEPTLAENPDNQRRYAGKELDAESGLNYFGARYFAAELGRFAAADPGQADGDPLHPQSWNAYAYSRNNPLRFVDPLGACSLDDAGNPVEDNESSTPIYAGSCIRFAAGASVSATSVSQLASRIAVQSTGMGEAALIQLLMNDAFAGAGALVGGVFGSGLAGGEVTGIGRIAPAAGRSGAFSVGQAGEAAVRSGFEIGAKTAIQVAGRVRIPDGLTNTVLSEVKNVRYLSYTQQLRDFAKYAASRGLRFDLYVRPTTQLSGPLAEQVARGAINLRYIP